MSDGQSRCEYDEPEETIPQERLKGGIPFAHELQWVTLHPFSSQQPFSLLLRESYSSVNLLSWILSIRISCSHQTGRFQARGNFFSEISSNTTFFAEAVPAADSHIPEPANEEPAQVALHSPSVGLD